ncbi:unnamed protein product, partial [marine sediment metagenome]
MITQTATPTPPATRAPKLFVRIAAANIKATRTAHPPAAIREAFTGPKGPRGLKPAAREDVRDSRHLAIDNPKAANPASIKYEPVTLLCGRDPV